MGHWSGRALAGSLALPLALSVVDCGRVDNDDRAAAEPDASGAVDASTDASSEAADAPAETSAKDAPDGAEDASPWQPEVLATLQFVEAMRVDSNAVFVAERSPVEVRTISRIDALTGQVSLVTNDVKPAVIDMVLTPERVIWTEYSGKLGSPPQSSTRAVAPDGGAVKDLMLLTPNAQRLALGASWLWFAHSQELKRYSLLTGEITSILGGVYGDPAADNTHVFFLHGSVLSRCEYATGTCSDLGVEPGGPMFSARVRDGFWYWMAGTTKGTFMLRRMPVSGGPASIVLEGDLFPAEFVVHEQLFWLEQGTLAENCDGRVMRATLSGAQPTTVASTCWPYAIAANDEYLFYLELKGGQTLLRRAPLH